ncbi:MAG TPA: DUF4129 domain-containing protein [Coleofasciculaceae cyanobacterium]|jgi:hypothetical protein
MATAAGTFEKTSFDWQLRQLQQQFGEWLQRLFLNDSNLPSEKWQLPPWLLEGLFWFIVIGLVSFLGWQLYRWLSPYLAVVWRSRQPSLAVSASTPEILPVAAWLQRSRQAQQQSNYREACRALYMAMLQRLNDQNLITQQPSRTDGEYATLLHTLSTLDQPQPYHLLLRTHERLCFSEADITAETYDRCWQAYREIDPTERAIV